VAGLWPAAVPIKPRITTFPETKLRTYVRRPNGRDGIWFLSLEVGSARFSRPAAPPYYLGDLSVSEHGGAVWYAGADVAATPPTHSPARRSDPALSPGHRAHRPMARLHPSLGIMPRPRALVGVVLPNPTNAGGGPAPRKSTS
jgi:hypothetical protein